MFWVIFISVIWIAALALVWFFFYQAAKINEQFDRDTQSFIERMHQHAESQGMPDDIKPYWLENELLASRRRVANGIWGGKPRKYLDS